MLSLFRVFTPRYWVGNVSPQQWWINDPVLSEWTYALRLVTMQSFLRVQNYSNYYWRNNKGESLFSDSILRIYLKYHTAVSVHVCDERCPTILSRGKTPVSIAWFQKLECPLRMRFKNYGKALRSATSLLPQEKQSGIARRDFQILVTNSTAPPSQIGITRIHSPQNGLLLDSVTWFRFDTNRIPWMLVWDSVYH